MADPSQRAPSYRRLQARDDRRACGCRGGSAVHVPAVDVVGVGEQLPLLSFRRSGVRRGVSKDAVTAMDRDDVLSMMAPEPSPAGWYPDPEHPRQRRCVGTHNERP